MIKISLVLPIYNEANVLREVLEKYTTDLNNAVSEFGGTYEIIAVNDASNDETSVILGDTFKKNTKLKILNISYRSGKQAAQTAGIDAATGDVVILADIDLLNPVGILKQLLAHYFTGNQIVYAYREKLKGEHLKAKTTMAMLNIAAMAFSVEGIFTGRAQIQLFSRDVADIIMALPNKNKYLRNMDNWFGYEVLKVEYPSEYSKTEIKQKLKLQTKRRKTALQSVVKRDKIREHTASLIYAYGLLITALITLTLNILIATTQTININFGLAIVLWLVNILFLTASILFFARTVLIKNIGLIHADTDKEIYKLAD